jgi:hypothetical protein
MSRATGEIEQTVGGIEVPAIIRAAGERAVTAYQEFLSNRKWSPNTLRLYGQQARRFFRWAEGRGLTLESIANGDIAAYATEVANAKSPHESSVYLTPVRRVFRQLVSSAVLSHDPCVVDISLAQLKELVLAVDPTLVEDQEFFEASLVLLAPLSIHTMDPLAISAFTGVALRDVQMFAHRLLENRCWRADGKIAVGSDDPDAWSVSVIINVLVATGMVEVRGEPEAATALVGDETELLGSAGQPRGERSDGE